ncbi:MAG TPA: pyridoxal-dependent decarboxylase [Spirochaetota bacterium]|nr:pyridoxal-dependent decarboxylase [Spirochaetota bacterium]HPI88222.1 pyridoxal-dependent decarboxylase [Spirochaetota bacterium]HPR47234.1 pyridoxal-dependent decarboxylase [Spirochaetota bacterium]
MHHEKLVKADMDHLRKLFIMPDSPDKFIEFGTHLLDLIHSFFTEKGGIHSSIALPDLAKLFTDIDLPKDPHLLRDVLMEIKNNIISHSVKVGNPYYVGHMTSAIPYFMILIEMIIAALNQNQVKIESAKASTFVERELISWMHRLVFRKSKKFYRAFIQDRDVALGNVCSDGTMANLTAMVVARNKAFRPDRHFAGVRRAGLYQALKYYGYDRAVIIVSRRGHYSFDKIARIIGLGDDNLIKIPVDSRNRMDIQELERVCREIEEKNSRNEERTKIIAIVGIAGTTETGNIDNLKEIRRVADEYNTHFHVDAAWGGAVLLVDELRYMFNGIESADSVTVDAHKLLYSPAAMGMVLFRSERELWNLKHYSNYIIRPDSVDSGRFTIEGSRPFSALKPWATFKILGSSGFKLLFEHAFELTAYLRGIIERHCNFEPMNQPELFIFNYRFVPKRIQEKIETIRLKIGTRELKEAMLDRYKMRQIDRLREINIVLNELNIELHKQQREEDDSFVSRTMIDSPIYFFQDIVILRAITVNPLTTTEIIKEIIEAQDRIGQKLYKSEFFNRLERI